MMRYGILVAFILASLPPAAAETVRIVAGEQPPLFAQSGGIVDMTVRRALEAAGYEVQFEWVPIGRMIALLRQDSVDVFISASNTPGQDIPHVSIYEANGVFFYKKARFPDLRAVRLEDLAGRRVSTIINSPNTTLFRASGMIVDEGPFESQFTKLDSGRVDFTATADIGGILAIKKQFPGRESEFTFTDLSYSALQAGLYARKDPALLAGFKKGLSAIKEDGTLNRMMKDFFGTDNWRRVRLAF